MARRKTPVKRGLLCLKIVWKGPYTRREVIDQFGNSGFPPEYDGDDYGLYQVYGRHILAGDTLLYVGKADRQTFSRRFKQHEAWPHSDKAKGQRVYLGRIKVIPRRHRRQDKWKKWEEDIHLAERIIIRKYSPNYNSSNIARKPKLSHETVVLLHQGDRKRLRSRDVAPDDT
jgi:hypothetical protein